MGRNPWYFKSEIIKITLKHKSNKKGLESVDKVKEG